MNCTDKNKKYRIVIVILILIILLLVLYIAIKGFGKIGLIPTGNIDIFNIIPDGDETTKEEQDKNDDNNSGKKNYNENTGKNNKNEENNTGIIKVYDDNKVWNSKNELRIFSNPAYEFKSIIAPGSSNVYKYVINNSENFDIIYTISFLETNENLINMKFKLKRNGEYIIGNETEYADIKEKSLKDLKLKSDSHDIYSLEWKWIDADNDTGVSFDEAKYKLNISIKAESYIG